ncbi:MAG: peptidoglycan-binding protein [Methanobrevibacter sp.]|nr:peptidoglycan-binding protein [Methanobrevibacter sp.]
MSFFSVIDARAIGSGAKPINLKVIQGNGVEVTPDLEITVNKLNAGNKSFLNNGYGGITFKIDVIIHKDEMIVNSTLVISNKWSYGSGKVIDYLHDWMTTLTPVYVVTDAIDIPNGKYIITKNSSRKQSYRNYTVWTLEFTEFKGINITQYKNDNSYVNKAKSNYAKAKAKARKQAQAKKNKKAKANNTNKNKLKKCKLANLKYGLKKSTCVKYMQAVLYKKGYLTKKQIDGWFGPVTKNALKKFQKKYQKKYKLKINGKVDNATLKALINV